MDMVRVMTFEDKIPTSSWQKAGDTHHGWNQGTVNINATSDSYESYFIARHEIGHVLGLSHEHQRADRDLYVVVDDPKHSDMTKLPEFIWTGGYNYTPLWGWFPWWTWVENHHQLRKSTMVGKFDYYSVMMYSSERLPQVFAKVNVDGNLRREHPTRTGIYLLFDSDQRITDTDVATIKALYPLGGYHAKAHDSIDGCKWIIVLSCRRL